MRVTTTLVDISFTLLFSGGLDIQVNQLLTIYDGDPQFFCLGRVKQHALHSCTPALRLTGTATLWEPARAPAWILFGRVGHNVDVRPRTVFRFASERPDPRGPGRKKFWWAVLSAQSACHR